MGKVPRDIILTIYCQCMYHHIYRWFQCSVTALRYELHVLWDINHSPEEVLTNRDVVSNENTSAIYVYGISLLDYFPPWLSPVLHVSSNVHVDTIYVSYLTP